MAKIGEERAGIAITFYNETYEPKTFFPSRGQRRKPARSGAAREDRRHPPPHTHPLSQPPGLPFNRPAATVRPVTYTEALRHYLAELRSNPKCPPPPLRRQTAREFRDWKAEMRAWDAARIKLKLATAQEVQAANDAFGGQGRGARIVQRAPYP